MYENSYDNQCFPQQYPENFNNLDSSSESSNSQNGKDLNNEFSYEAQNPEYQNQQPSYYEQPQYYPDNTSNSTFYQNINLNASNETNLYYQPPAVVESQQSNSYMNPSYTQPQLFTPNEDQIYDNGNNCSNPGDHEIYMHYNGGSFVVPGWKSAFSVFNPCAHAQYSAPHPPKGYQVKHTKNGMPYFVHEDEDNIMKSKEILPLKCTLKDIEKNFGFSIFLYFDWTRLLIWVYIIILLLQFINVISFFIAGSKTFFIGDYGLKSLTQNVLPPFLFTSIYPPDVVWCWRVINIICIIFSLALGPLYFHYIHRIFAKRGYFDPESRFVHPESDIIKENEGYTIHQRIGRRIASYSIFTVLVIIDVIVTLCLTIAINFSTLFSVFGNSGSKIEANQWIMTPLSFAMSVVISIMNFVFYKLCYALTNLEKHRTWSRYKFNRNFKYMSFRLINIFILTFIKGFFAVPCILTVLGNQFLMQIITEFLFTNVFECIQPLIMIKIAARKGKEEVEKVRPDFDVDEEYLDDIYKLYLLYCGMVSFPLMPILCLVIHIVDLNLCKWRLLRLSKPPPKTIGSCKSLVTYFLITAALLAIINFGGGNAYKLIGWYWCNPPPGESCYSMQCGIFTDVQTSGFLPSLSTLIFPNLYGASAGNSTKTTLNS